MKDFSDPLYDELMDIVNAYCAIDPDSDWDEEEWQAFLKERATAELLALLQENAKMREEAKREGRWI